MTSITDNATPNDLLASIRQACDKLEEVKGLSNAEEQIRHVLGDGWHKQLAPFNRWCRDQVMPVLSAFELEHSAKKMVTAQQHKQLADLYLGMVEKQFADKAFQCLTQAIIWAPFSEEDFLIDCFLARSGLHQRSKNYDAALADIDRALFFKADSLPTIQRKVALLKRLDRGPDAYTFVEGLLKSYVKGKDREVLKCMKKDMKRFKRSKIARNKQDYEELWPDHYLEVDSRLKWTLNTPTNRHVLKATESIPAETTLVCEEPALFVVRAESFHTHCNMCFVECTNTCWPCSSCSDVVFCSNRCATRADLEYHTRECGIINALVIKETIPPQVLQVYRHLSRAGHHDLIKLHGETEAGHYVNLSKLIGSEKISRGRAQSIFAQNASMMHQQISIKQPLRSATELANAIFLLVIYCNKANIKQMDTDEMCLLARILATDLVRVTLTEYGWYGSSGSDKRVHIGNYQCLVGSMLSHSCEPNVEWKFDEKRFIIKTIRAVKPDDEISITFGPTASQSFFLRQTQVLNFSQMCNCKLCKNDALSHFAIRCTYCNGSIPFEPEKFKELRCMLCERKFEHGLAKAKTIHADFRAMQRSVWLVRGVQSAESASVLQQIEERMAILATAIPTCNRQLLAAVGDLCREYIRRKKYNFAVDWFQWFSNINIFIDIEDKHDLLIRLHHFEQWTLAYLNFLPSLAPDHAKAASYIDVCKNLLQQTSKAIKELPESGVDKAMALDKAQFEEIVEMLRDRADCKWRQFEEICSALQKCVQTGKCSLEEESSQTRAIEDAEQKVA